MEEQSTIIEPSLVQLFKAVGHAGRLEILFALRSGEACVCHLEAVLGYRQAYISQQLSILREANLIIDRREGWNIYYSVRDARIFDLLEKAQQLIGKKTMIPAIPREILACACPKCSPLHH